MKLLRTLCLTVSIVGLVGGCGSDASEELETAPGSAPAVDCPTRPRPAAPETGAGHGDYFPPYKSLDDLTGASDVVVLGEVTKVGRGAISGAQPGHGGFQAMAVTLDVLETYRGDVGDEVVFNEGGWSLGPPERPTAEAGVHRAAPGDCGFYFLRRDIHANALALTSIQGKFLAEEADGLFAGFERSDPLSDQLAAMSFTQFRGAVKAAAKRVDGVSPRDVECRQSGPRPVECGADGPAAQK